MAVLRWLLVLSLPLTVVCGCGKKGDPMIPRALGPKAVKKFKAVARSGGIILAWKAPRENTDGTPLLDLDGFRIFREELSFEKSCKKCPKNFLPLYDYAYRGPRGKVPERMLYTYTDRTVKVKQVYTYKIHCYNERGIMGPASDLVSIWWDVPPAPPSQVQAEKTGRTIVVTWKKPDTREDGAPLDAGAGFNVYRTITQGVYEEEPLNSEPLAETSFEDLPDTYDVTYYYTVRALRSVGESVLESTSSPEVAVAYMDITPPGAPQGVFAVSTDEGVLVKWLPKSEKGCAGFNLYRKEPREKDLVRINTELIRQNSWVDKTARQGKIYVYRVTAADQSVQQNESPMSEPVTIRYLLR